MDAQNEYIVYDISDALSSGSVEYLGSKRKGWLTYRLNNQNLRVLFKQGRPGTGEDWAEKVTSELAGLLGLPHATYDLAELGKNDPCVISANFLKDGEQLRLGNELIEGFGKDQKFKNNKHTLRAILNALQQNSVQLPSQTPEQDLMITNASELFIGYLCFDIWIANTDRHAENWGVITKTNYTNVLAPTFDHASSLGRNESDASRIERLRTKDRGYNVAAYVQRAMTPIYDDKGQMLNTTQLAQECKNYLPQATDYWVEKIGSLMDDEQKIRAAFDRVTNRFISQPARDFAMCILKEGAKRLRGLKND